MKTLSRRTLLRGAGATLALPLLEAMPQKQPVRLAFVYVPNGVIMDQWTPTATGAAFDLPRILQPLHPHRHQLLVLSGLAHNNGRALGDGAGDHARASASYLTGVHPKKTAGADIKNGISVDQIAANHLGRTTRFASLEFGLEHGRQAGNCDSGYSCAYTNSLAWRSESTPLPPEVNPKLIFDRLFGTGEQATSNTQAERKSILDFIREDAASLHRELGTPDRRKMDEYLTGIRELEKRIESSAQAAAKLPKPEIATPYGIPAEFEEHARLMFDLMTIALKTDSTRVLTMMIAREGSNLTYRQAGVPEAHHQLSHHQGDKEKIEKLTKINTYHVSLFSNWLTKLSETEENGTSLLDNTIVVYGSGLSDGNRHDHHDLPILLAGGRNTKLRLGHHVQHTPETPVTNLWLSLLDRVAVPTRNLGDSREALGNLLGHNA